MKYLSARPLVIPLLAMAAFLCGCASTAPRGVVIRSIKGTGRLTVNGESRPIKPGKIVLPGTTIHTGPVSETYLSFAKSFDLLCIRGALLVFASVAGKNEIVEVTSGKKCISKADSLVIEAVIPGEVERILRGNWNTEVRRLEAGKLIDPETSAGAHPRHDNQE